LFKVLTTAAKIAERAEIHTVAITTPTLFALFGDKQPNTNSTRMVASIAAAKPSVSGIPSKPRLPGRAHYPSPAAPAFSFFLLLILWGDEGDLS